jgi:hypothetical protein
VTDVVDGGNGLGSRVNVGVVPYTKNNVQARVYNHKKHQSSPKYKKFNTFFSLY